MVVGVVAAELHLPECRSLKQKRRVVKSLVDRVHQRFRVSVAETDFWDLHQRSEIGIAVVCGSASEAEQKLEAIHRLFDEPGPAWVTRWATDLIESD